MELCIRNPETFAAAMFVAGQWDPLQIDKLTTQKMLYMVSEGDAKAGPGMDVFMHILDGQGAAYGTAIWDATWAEEQIEQEAQQLFKTEKPIYCVKFKRGSVVPKPAKVSPVTEHIYTWDVAYLIDEARNWILSQSKDVP